MSTPLSSHPRVLLADDDCAVRAALGDALESEGFAVLTAGNGHEALAKFCGNRADIVLLDVNMPVKGGWETLAWFRSICPLVPIIIITARADAHRALPAGVVLMEKPLDLPRLVQTIRDLLARSAEERLRAFSGEASTPIRITTTTNH